MIGLVYLLWGPLGPRPVRDFVRSYRAHQAGAEHELTVVLNGVPAADASPATATGTGGHPAQRRAGAREALLAELEGIQHRTIELDRPVLDLAAYGLAADELQHGRLCFLNSYSVILCDGWLARLAGALDRPRAAIAGASGSWESQAEWVRGKTLHWPLQLARLRTARRDYPRFPNPHIRTTGFIVERQLIHELRLSDARDKRDTYLLESGRHSITQQILGRGLRALVAGRDDLVYDAEDWPNACTYRSGNQRNLLVGDRRTQDWELASPRLRRRLSRDAWGDPSA